MSYIDRICAAVFGCALPVVADDRRQVVDIEGLPDVADLLRLLS
jgi:hypothetical protein